MVQAGDSGGKGVGLDGFGENQVKAVRREDQGHAEVQEETLGARAGCPLAGGHFLLVVLEVLQLEMEPVNKQPRKCHECFIMIMSHPDAQYSPLIFLRMYLCSVYFCLLTSLWSFKCFLVFWSTGA